MKEMKLLAREPSYMDDITKCCALCERGTLLGGTDYVLCPKNGAVPADHTCRKFIFDPLKRKPHGQIVLKEAELEVENDGN